MKKTLAAIAVDHCFTITLTRAIRFLVGWCVFNAGLMAILFSMLMNPEAVFAAGTVGTGTPGSCTEGALDTALVGGGLVTFNCGTNPVTITVTSQKTIANNTTINGGNLVTISGNNATRVFSVTNGIALTLMNLTVSNGYVVNQDGGAIYNNGTLTLTGTTFYSNTVINTTSDSDPTLGNGGAIYSLGTVTIDGSSFSNNRAVGAFGGSPRHYVGNGGAIKCGNNSNRGTSLNVTNSVFTNNFSDGVVGGGAISSFGALAVTSTTFISNTAWVVGGAIDDESFASSNPSMVTASTFLQNTSGYGGAVYAGGAKITITDSDFFTNTAVTQGGAIYNQAGIVTVNTSYFRANATTGGWDSGGGAIGNLSGLTVQQSTFESNRVNGTAGVQGGGGIWNSSYDYGRLTVANSTFSGNHSDTVGGGVFATGTNVQITNTTFVSNTTGVVSGGGNITGTAKLKNTLLTGGKASGSDNNCGGAIVSNGYNLENGNTCGLTATGDLTNTNPLVGALQNNGGRTLTHALLVGSPAINQGTNTGCPATDQRGVTRPQGAMCDIGAYEAEMPSLISTNPSSATVGDPGFTLTITGTGFVSGATVLWNGASRTTGFVSSTRLTATIPSSDLTVAGSANVTVRNPDGYTSNALTFAIYRPSTTAVTSAPNPSAFGQSVTFTATVTSGGGTPTGTVQFKDGGTNLGSPVSLTSGIATLITTTLSVGSHAITATYSGDTNYAASTGTLSGGQGVSKANQTITFPALGSKVVSDPPFSITATASSGLLVSFLASGTCTVSASALNAGVSTATVTLTGAGSCTITAQQPGDTNYNAAPDVPRTFSVSALKVFLPLTLK
jgi:hypothetical protein